MPFRLLRRTRDGVGRLEDTPFNWPLTNQPIRDVWLKPSGKCLRMMSFVTIGTENDIAGFYQSKEAARSTSNIWFNCENLLTRQHSVS